MTSGVRDQILENEKNYIQRHAEMTNGIIERISLLETKIPASRFEKILAESHEKFEISLQKNINSVNESLENSIIENRENVTFLFFPCESSF